MTAAIVDTSEGSKALKLLAWSLAIVVFAAATATYYLSLNHSIRADMAMLHYSAWLINEQSFLLYRDIFELNFPGPFLFHSVIGKALGYEAIPMQIINGIMLLMLGVVSWKLLAPVSRPAAIFAPSLFTLFYMANGGEYILEREFLCLLPAAAAVMCATSRSHPLQTRTLLCAVLAAIACSMKPNAIVFVPALLWQLIQQSQGTGCSKRRVLLLFFIAMLITASIPFLWAMQYGSLSDFIQIYKTFVPIYASSRYDLFHYDNSVEHYKNLFENYLKWGGISLLLSCTGLGWAWSARKQDSQVQQRIIELAVITLAFSFYEVLAGKFWTNHMFPSAYWTIVCMSLVLTTPNHAPPFWKYIFFAVVLIPAGTISYFLCAYSPQQMLAHHEKELREPESWRARKIASFLIANQLQPDDRVQMMDMAGDGQAALLLAKATSATRHLIDVPLYMQPSSAAIQALREEFIQHLQQKQPRFIVYVEQFLHPGGGNRLREFKSLSAMVDADYAVAEQRDGEYIIFQRKTANPLP